ncbi:MAG: hypothetical protein LUI04_07130 [Porphyromonadaceae bacterium]|nr:hypothetical protein [Porphyromonadaceae bacterium]
MKKLSALLFATLFAAFSFTSCSDDDNDNNNYGITALTVVTSGGGSYAGVISQTDITCTVPMTTQTSELEACTLSVTTTTNTTVTVNGEAIEGETFDLNDPIVLTATNGSKTKEYTLTVVISEDEGDLATGEQMTSDIRNSGIPSDVYDYSVAYFNGKFYAFTSGLTDTIASYKVFTSTNGISWTEVSTPEIIGGFGARPVVYNDQLYIISGIRVLGYDEEGNAPETKVSFGQTSCTLDYLRTWTTSDGSTWNNEAVEYDMTKIAAGSYFDVYLMGSMFPWVGVHPFVYDGNLYFQSGACLLYGTFQNSVLALFEKNEDSYDMVNAVSSYQKAGSSYFVLNDQVFIMGGYNSFISNGMLSTVYASSDGMTTFESVADETAVGAISGATVVTNKAGDTAYLFGGLVANEETGGNEINNNVYKTTDGINWEAIEVNADYVGSYDPSVVVDDNNIAWVFAGLTEFVGTYTPYSLSVDDMNPSFTVWAFALD